MNHQNHALHMFSPRLQPTPFGALSLLLAKAAGDASDLRGELEVAEGDSFKETKKVELLNLVMLVSRCFRLVKKSRCFWKHLSPRKQELLAKRRGYLYITQWVFQPVFALAHSMSQIDVTKQKDFSKQSRGIQPCKQSPGFFNSPAKKSSR